MDELALTTACPHQQRRAFVSFLTGSGDYVKGAVALAKSLRAVNSAYPLIVAVTECVPVAHQRLLRREGCIVREVARVAPPGGGCGFEFAREYYAVNFSKLRIWQFDDFDKLVYLDADMLLFQNVDELFNSPPGTLSAVMDCFCAATPAIWHQSVPRYRPGYCQQVPDRLPWPRDAPKPAPYFNAGMLVFQPSCAVFDDMLRKLAEWPPTPMAEQDFLNRYFAGAYRPVPNRYNLVLAMLWWHPDKVDVSSVKNVHYCAKGSKPWDFNPSAPHMDLPIVRELVAHWLEIYGSDPASGAIDGLETFSAAAIAEAEMQLSAAVQQEVVPGGIMAG
ncbi:galactinol synthase [Klebsormidium nitens]|uniref:Hexosyltransferase n=1 Tax=Klebsormidium nitens TaxID=105231 RepID=A0A1Y1IJG5_KLENI|nr:galactinol synthase [Klebsormidium nitens]|eukprot:GAQ88767.1 galactinol synthase [Klebsormidium nitens]